MKSSHLKIKTTISFILSVFLIIGTVLPLLGFVASQAVAGELMQQIGLLRILVYYLFLGILSIISWTLAHEIILQVQGQPETGLHLGFAYFVKIVSLLVVILMATVNIFFLLGVVIVYPGATILGLDFGNVRFFYQDSFWLILSHFIVPLVIVFYIFAYKQKKKILGRFGNLKLIGYLSTSVNRRAQLLKTVLLVAALFYLIVAWARPQFGTKLETVKREGVDIVIALDVSFSMMAEDITPNRLEKAKHEIEALIDKLKGDRVGLVAFAGVPFIQCPLTLDYGAAKIFLDVMAPDLIPVPGTAIGKAILESLKAFEQSERKYKVLILITDGEDHEDDPVEIAKKAEEQGVVIYAVGIGTPGGVPIPVYGQQGGLKEFKKDRSGQEVVSKLDEVTLEKVALQTNGKYYRASSGEVELDKIYDDISTMEKKELASKKFSQYEDRFQFILVFALFLMIIEVFISERKKIRTV